MTKRLLQLSSSVLLICSKPKTTEVKLILSTVCWKQADRRLCVFCWVIVEFKCSKSRDIWAMSGLLMQPVRKCLLRLDAPFSPMTTLLADMTQTTGQHWWRQGSLGLPLCVCVCVPVLVCVTINVPSEYGWWVFIRFHVCVEEMTEDNALSLVCNRCSSQLEPICCYQREQRCLQQQLRWNLTDS